MYGMAISTTITAHAGTFIHHWFLSKSILAFEFGCASGPNLANIRYRCSGTVYLVGHDINRAAISLAEKNLSDPNTQFTYSLSDAKLIECLKSKRQTDRFSIYDRVLYLL